MNLLESNAPSSSQPSDRLSRLIVNLSFFVALALGLYLRTIALNGPPYENHAFRQTQTLSTIEDFHRHGIDLLHPKTIYMGYPGTFVLETPLFQALAALAYQWVSPQVAVVRALNILFGLGSTWLLFIIARNYFNQRVAMLAAMIFWLAPLNIIFHRSTLIDPAAVFLALACYLLSERLVFQKGVKAERPAQAVDWIAFGLSAFSAAMIKALYLWPVVLLFGFRLAVSRQQFSRRRISAAFGVFAFSGICFVLWNLYATKVNNASIFTQGVKPTSLLGVSALFSPDFYSEILLHRSKRLLGAFGLLFFPIGLWAAWSERRRSEVVSNLLPVILIPPSYLLFFANINRPHDYYQLIIAPFLALVAAYGLAWMGTKLSMRFKSTLLSQAGWIVTVAVLAASSAFTYRHIYRWPQPDSLVLEFDQLCSGKFEPHRPALVFVASDRASCPPGSYIPEFIYAANLWGFGVTVTNHQETKLVFEKFAPGFTNLEYLVFYGMPYPEWVTTNSFHLDLRDDQNRLFAFRQPNKN